MPNVLSDVCLSLSLQHISLLLYFLIHEVDTHSLLCPNRITLGFPDTEMFLRLFSEHVLGKAVILASLALNVVFSYRHWI